jgi:hypothetical protein
MTDNNKEVVESFSFSIHNHLERGGIQPPTRELTWEVNGVKHTKWQHILNGRWMDDDDDD